MPVLKLPMREADHKARTKKSFWRAKKSNRSGLIPTVPSIITITTPTSLSQLPLELVEFIFSWIDPRQLLSLCRLSRAIHTFIATSRFFATLNLSNFNKSRRHVPVVNSLLFLGPRNYQHSAAEMICLYETGTLQWSNRWSIPVSIPPFIGILHSLKTLHLSRCSLIGYIPQEITQLSRLERLDLSHNKLSGTIPSTFHNLKNLVEFNVCCNSLEGDIPSEICELKLLEVLNLGYNKLQGKIPHEIGNLARLRELVVCGNTLSGVSMDAIVCLVALEYLYLGVDNCGLFLTEMDRDIVSQVANGSMLSRLVGSDLIHVTNGHGIQQELVGC